MRYVLLHSLSHTLIRQFSLECGYSTASIRERIYSRPQSSEHAPMAGLLLYTAWPDSEGTLGGLVSLGDPKALGRHLDQVLETMRLCASDPLCAEHHPHLSNLTLHAAACHACLFLPETSCERGNKYLDRSVLVSTVDRADLAFFTDFSEALPEKTITAHTDVSATPQKPESKTTSALDEMLDYCDERCRSFVRSWSEKGLPLPLALNFKTILVGSVPMQSWRGSPRRLPPCYRTHPIINQHSRPQDGRYSTLLTSQAKRRNCES